MAWNEDDTLYGPDGSEMEVFDIQEHLFDELSDHFDGYPWEVDQYGNMTPNGEKVYGKLFALFVKNFFPRLWEEEYSKQNFYRTVLQDDKL